MPVIKSAIKRVRTNEKNHARNLAVKNEYRAALRHFEEKARTDDTEEAKQAYADASRKLDRAARKRVVHPNKAARLKSKMAKKLNDMTA